MLEKALDYQSCEIMLTYKNFYKKILFFIFNISVLVLRILIFAVKNRYRMLAH